MILSSILLGDWIVRCILTFIHISKKESSHSLCNCGGLMSAVNQTHVPRELAYPRQLPSAVAVVFPPRMLQCHDPWTSQLCLLPVRSFFLRCKGKDGLFLRTRVTEYLWAFSAAILQPQMAKILVIVINPKLSRPSKIFFLVDEVKCRIPLSHRHSIDISGLYIFFGVFDVMPIR